MKIPKSGTISRQIFDMASEFPGVKITTAEIAAECELSSHSAGSHAARLVKDGLLKKEANGRGSKAVFWMEP